MLLDLSDFSSLSIVQCFCCGSDANSVAHVHLTTFWTIALGIIASILGGAVNSCVLAPEKRTISSRRPHFSTLGDLGCLHLLSAHVRLRATPGGERVVSGAYRLGWNTAVT
jgi:hypothetical protein